MNWSPFTDDELRSFSSAILRVARELKRSRLPPPGMPFYGLDMTNCEPAVLDRFSEQGIFRKYQRAVSLDCGLGGVARWWSVRFGCSVACIENRPALVAAAARFAAATRAGAEFSAAATDPCAAGLRDCRFTNAWRAEDADEVADPDAFLAEVFRVLRPGGFFAMRAGADGPAWLERLASHGFQSLSFESLPPLEVSAAVAGAEQVLDAFLSREIAGAAVDRLLALSGQMAAARRDARPTVLVFAERPA
jgi:SAM-dependent methyltransferase